jgi:hypothetical protein
LVSENLVGVGGDGWERRTWLVSENLVGSGGDGWERIW